MKAEFYSMRQSRRQEVGRLWNDAIMCRHIQSPVFVLFAVEMEHMIEEERPLWEAAQKAERGQLLEIPDRLARLSLALAGLEA